ncbi:MAG: DUF4382 domain-containing protein [Pseudomonadota bacterium]
MSTSRHPIRPMRRTVAALAPLALLAACGGGGSSSDGQGTLRMSMTDAPACGYDAVYVTVEKVRVHQSANAAEADAGWHEIVLSPAKRVDLLSLTNGVLEELGQTALPAGHYTQLRLQLAANGGSGTPANAVVVGGNEIALDTPSAQQSGLKLNANIEVEADKVADFVLDFDACKSVVKRGNSGRYNLKPVVSIIPRLSDAGMRVVGYVAPALATTGTQVSVQLNGVPVKATPPDATGRFTLYPVPAGTYDLVVSAEGRVTATITGVPVTTSAYTYVNAQTAPIDPPAATMRSTAGVVSTGATPVDAMVRVLKAYTGGPTVEVAAAPADAVTGAFGFSLPSGAPVKMAYVASASTLNFTADSATPTGKYTLEAASGLDVKTQAIDLSTADALGLSLILP